MEPPSASPRAGRGPWRELLLAVSLLTFWNPPTTAQVTVESVPPDAAEGKDVLLRVLNLPGDLLAYHWFRGKSVETNNRIVSYMVNTQVIAPGHAHSGKETAYPNGSLLFQNITLKDAGYYTLQIITNDVQVEQVLGQLQVFYGPDTPTISPSDSYYHLGGNLSVSCHAASNPPAQYSWLINERPQPSTQELFIPNITVNDGGSYTCLVYISGTCLNKTTVKTNTVSDKGSTTGLPVGSIIGIALGVLIGVALMATLAYFLLCTRTGRASAWHDLRQLWHPASTACHAPVSSSTSPASLPSPTKEVPIYQELQHPDTSIYCQINHKAEVAS
ncbi:carcinoembryonic antigen-related cell adhesion molecule 3-like isoform X1 [Vulpes lagopus]|uniref:carcinoembryonic antigen-related cell adhesion molecule 3-like isoform X1 n=1 Tax=Vulpes lagopus TaxID=494514 RepID=UPI001BC99EDA|nr:carcinoembryonic antigen-related cell adhesion molecule 3-like isoform X1 [Vulpes lagopus]XP_041601228.1 carcinoembryonic antigen-related cell adhesion molecule 3-like isoform X1 [Vulpes lagopus]XP_041601229.1 carcinoembryonic antigen-related cell adhesion molecule 3-like isoform X1 [Vulpes lagopus]XP_041601230.1 carcinoembryonic antigen-related cell adhesion molecule 3-like isoform X1 [Vulpes lagopus]